MMRTLTTERLTLRAICAEDWLLIHAIQADPKHGYWVRGPNIPASEERSRASAERSAAQWAEHGWGPYLLTLHSKPIGYAGLRLGRIEEIGVFEALWGLKSAHHGSGYASEAMRAVLDGPMPEGCTSICAWTLPDNHPSRHLMARLGFRYERDAKYADLTHVVYRLTV